MVVWSRLLHEGAHDFSNPFSIESQSLHVHRTPSSGKQELTSALDVVATPTVRGGTRGHVLAAFLEGPGTESLIPLTSPSSRNLRGRHGLDTAFGDKDDKADPTEPLPASRVWLFRGLFWGGATVSFLGSRKLRNVIETRATRKVEEKPPENTRAFTEGVRDAASRTDQDGVVLAGDRVESYDMFVLLSPFRRMSGTVFDEMLLWQLQCEVWVPFFITAAITLESTHALSGVLLPLFHDVLVNDGAVKRMTDYTKALAAFNSFFLGMLTSITLKQWQEVWKDGIMKVTTSTAKLCTFISSDTPETWSESDAGGATTVHRADVVEMVQRWSRASFHLLFTRYGRKIPPQESIAEVRRMGYLTEEEQNILIQTGSDEHIFAIWGWIFNLFSRLTRNKILTGVPIQRWDPTHHEGITGLNFVISRVSRGQFPYTYMSLISFFVKFYAMSTSTLGGVAVVRSLMHSDEVEAIFTFLGVTLIPFLMNAVVLLNMNLSNPLSEHFTSIPEMNIGEKIVSTSGAISKANNFNRPQVLARADKWQP